MMRSSVWWVEKYHGQPSSELSALITGANGVQCSGYLYQKKQQSSDFLGHKLGGRTLTN
jgi:hypothetical protein